MTNLRLQRVLRPRSMQTATTSSRPPGAPPGHSSKQEEYMPPPGAPPEAKAKEQAPPPYDPWMAVPDSTLLPPPPSFKQEQSWSSNADFDDAARGHEWVAQNPLWQPRQHDQHTLYNIRQGDIRLTMPPRTKNVKLDTVGVGRNKISTNNKCQDTIFLSDIPLFATLNDNPLRTERPKKIYYELEVKSMGGGSAEAAIALGFLAPPYPSWRQPGWHRSSLAVHGDDGRRYIDNSDGGRDFVQPFQRGDVVGIGMVHGLPIYAGGKQRVEVFFTRNGRKEGEWDLNEDLDKEEEGGDVRGLQGEYDLLAAVGCFGPVEFEVRFRPDEWIFRP